MLPAWRLPARRLCPDESIDKWSRGGFTLVEMIIVCVLIGLMLSLTVPTMRNTIFADPLKSSTRKVIGLVNGVRELAAREQQAYLLHISEAENRLWYEKEIHDAASEEDTLQDNSELQLPDAVKISGLLIGGGQTLQQDNSVIWISKHGFIQQTAIRLENDDGDTLT
ncbi:MAG: pilus assembly FimT family protein, partial [Desulforhopalus sp.]